VAAMATAVGRRPNMSTSLVLVRIRSRLPSWNRGALGMQHRDALPVVGRDTNTHP
jgi:hypothetical protein